LIPFVKLAPVRLLILISKTHPSPEANLRSPRLLIAFGENDGSEPERQRGRGAPSLALGL
jgi:hypothetical protein